MFDERVTFCVCAVSLLFFFITYGIAQEKIMTQQYGPDKKFFRHSGFIVFANRTLCTLFAASVLLITQKDIKLVAPLPSYAAVAISNIISTFCAYEALKHVSFPTQTLAKSAKMIAVMLVGQTLFFGKRYSTKDYLIAFGIGLGLTAFLLSGNTTSKVVLSTHKENDEYETDESKPVGTTVLIGLALLALYLIFDGVTSSLQERLFSGYSMSLFNQLFYVNLISAVLSGIFLIVTNTMEDAIQFTLAYPHFAMYVILLSVAVLFGQVAIYATIQRFGALAFSTIMTTRQMISIVLSSFIFWNPLTLLQWFSAGSVSILLYYHAYRKSTGS